MGLRRRSPLSYSINMRGGARGIETSHMEALAARVVLTHPHAGFHPCTCELHGGAAVIAAALISYDNVEVAAQMTTGRRRS
jgi:hypothetical protein